MSIDIAEGIRGVLERYGFVEQPAITSGKSILYSYISFSIPAHKQFVVVLTREKPSSLADIYFKEIGGLPEDIGLRKPVEKLREIVTGIFSPRNKVNRTQLEKRLQEEFS